MRLTSYLLRVRTLLPVLLAALLLSVAACFVPAGKAHADLTVYVGYAGGPYYEKKTYTEAELWGMSDGVIYQYSSIDSGGSVRKGFGVGVHLYDLFTGAGVDPDAMWRFYFTTYDSYIEDDGGAGYDAWYYSNLVDTDRYYYAGLPEYFDFDAHQIMSMEAMAALEESRLLTPTILALQSSYEIVSSADDSRWDDLSMMSGERGYRLMYGQTAPNVMTARSSAHSIQAVTCVLGGSEGAELPEIDLSLDDRIESGELEMEVGESITLFPSLKSGDSTVSAEGIHDVTWTTSDPDVATVVKNEDGSITITVVGEGLVSIGYSYGNSPYAAFVSTGSFGVSGSGGTGDGEGDGGSDEPEDDGDEGGEAESITIEDGIEMFPASLEASSEGDGGSPSASPPAGEADSTGETVTAEEMLTITAKPSVYQLEFDEEIPDDANPGWVYAVAAGSCLAVGGMRRRQRFEQAKDRLVPLRAPADLHEYDVAAGGVHADRNDDNENERAE